jgi:putative membrane protein insertion efficiency factor
MTDRGGKRERTPRSAAALLIVASVRGYQLTVARVLPPSCRFHPTWSEYMIEAVSRFGAVRGVWMGLGRIARCHPFHPGGYDPVRRR